MRRGRGGTHELRDRVSKALEGGSPLVSYWPGCDEPVEPVRAPPKPSLPGVWRIECWQDADHSVWFAQAWRSGQCCGKGAGSDPRSAAQRARRSAKHAAAADWAWRCGERCVQEAYNR
jgi:hypothetical protein